MKLEHTLRIRPCDEQGPIEEWTVTRTWAPDREPTRYEVQLAVSGVDLGTQPFPPEPRTAAAVGRAFRVFDAKGNLLFEAADPEGELIVRLDPIPEE